MRKQEVNIQTAISFLQEITGNTNIMASKQNGSEAVVTPRKAKTISLKSYRLKDFEVDYVEISKQIKEKNTKPKQSSQSPYYQHVMDPQYMIKTANIIQQTLDKYYFNDQPTSQVEERSSQTRLNIYFRQNARILRQIRKQNEIVRSNNEGNIEEKELRLARQFQFTVKDDCRDYVSISIQKTQQKLSKLIEDEGVFKQMLLVMADNQLKVYRDKFQTKILRTIRMYEIQHISYNQQPVKCIMIGFLKDKSKAAEYLYLKFDNNQDHDKWDRIIYINFKLWQMKKRKDKLFLTDFREDQFKPWDFEAQVFKYDVDFDNTVNSLLKQEQTITKSKDRDKSSKDREGQKEKERDKQFTLKQFSIKGANSHDIRSREDVINIKQPRQPEIIIHHSPDHMTKSLINAPMNNQLSPSENKSQYERSNTNDFNNHPISPKFQSKLSIENPSLKQNLDQDMPGSFQEKSFRILQKSQMIIDEPKSPSNIRTNKLPELQKILEKGIYVTKHNLFRNSKKKVFPSPDAIQYADQKKYQEYVLAVKNKDKKKQAPKKKIPIDQIQKIQNQTLKDGQTKLTVYYSNGKKFVITGDQGLDTYVNWLKLKCAYN